VNPDLSTSYLGLDLRAPLIASSTPMTGDPATCRLLEAAGAGAIVLPSLFEEEIVNEEIELSRSLDAGTEQFGEALSYFPTLDTFKGVGERYLARLEKTRQLVSIPVIASLNAATPGGWVRYARLVQDAGADALELNLYHVVADPSVTGAAREATDLELIAAVRAAVTIPLAVKLSPYYSALAGFASDAVAAGADGLVLFNRFYQPDLDLETFDVVNKVALSHPSELRMPLRWIAILRPQLGVGVGLAATSGVHGGTDAAKALLVGADVAMVASAILRDGPERMRVIHDDLVAWMTRHEYDSVAQLRGSASAASVADPTAFERANYMATLHSWSTPHDLATA
jgi:dihydroorotate dehydrogenase (fumarate)